MRAPEHAKILARVDRDFADHQVTDRPTRSFHFATPGTSHYAFSLTWTPGSLVLAGDIGEMTLTHYSACRHLEAGLSWLATSSAEYLLGKSDKTPVADKAETLRQVIFMANDQAIHTMRSQRDELRDWRRGRPTLSGTPDEIEFEAELASWKEDKPTLQFVDGWTTKMRGRKVAPDGFENWERLREILDPSMPQEAIFTGAGRADLKGRLDAEIDRLDGIEISRWIYDHLQNDDWYGSFDYEPHVFYQVEAMIWAATRALSFVEAEAQATA